MNWRNANLIFRREVCDQLRDRRTLFMIVVLPVLLYPALGLGLMQLTLQFGRESRTVGIVGYENLPNKPPLLNEAGDRFDVDLFTSPENQRYFEVWRDNSWTVADLRAGRIDALIVVPQGAKEQLANGAQIEIELLRYAANDDSEVAYHAALAFLEAWEKKLIVHRMEQLGKSAEFANPVLIDEESSDISSSEARSGTAWSRLFPFLLVMMSLTGAFYPAIDLCAGEKERGTMETLLITPAARSEIVAGKFLTILLFSVATTVCNLVSMGVTFSQISRAVAENAGEALEQFAPPSLAAIGWMLVLMLPLAAFFSALCMAFAVFARSTKEGQYYLMPMFLIVTPLVFLTMAPGVELTVFYSLVPVTNVALLLRALMLSQYDVASVFMMPVLVPTVLYSYLALRFALDRFNREEVLFREAERFELGLWIRHLLRHKEPTPTGAEAWFCYVMMLLLVWYSQGRLPNTLGGIATSQLGFIAFPPLLMALLLTSDPRRTLGLRLPVLSATCLAILLVFTLHPVVVELGRRYQELFPLSEELQRALLRLLAGTSLTQRLFFLALLPAVCEEIAFRGFILAGLRRRQPTHLAILISSVLFGVFHLIPQQMVTAVLLGLVLAIIATRTGSILPGIVFHALHNGMVLIHGNVGSSDGMAPAAAEPMGWSVPIVVMGALASALLIGALVALRVPPLPAATDGSQRL